jgi:hypothetical protein
MPALYQRLAASDLVLPYFGFKIRDRKNLHHLRRRIASALFADIMVKRPSPHPGSVCGSLDRAIRERCLGGFCSSFEGWELFLQASNRRRLRYHRRHDCEGQRHSVVSRD